MQNKLSLRSPRFEDAETVYNLVISCDIEDFGTPDFDLQELLDMWSGFDMEKNVWVVEDQKDNIVGYAFLEEDSEEKLFSYGFVLPSARGTGVGSILLNAIEERGQALADMSGIHKRLQNLVPSLCEDAHKLLEVRGFIPVRYFKRMSIKMDQVPPAPSIPAGVKITTFVPNQDEQSVYDTYVETFTDHWDYSVPAYDTWLERTKLPSFTPEWWFVARNDKNEIVGIALSRMNEDALFINQIGVRRSYRGMGLGFALLQHAKQVSYSAGQPVVSLGVDSANLSGADRLYEKAGMRVIHEVTLFEKPLTAKPL